jgi:sugar/nucleoside kinase (ribokinase family)
MSRFDVLCIGNAIVDIIARCDEAFLVDNHIIKGAMNLIDADRAELLYSRMGPAIEASGGSAGNTAAGIASFGSRAAYFGKVSEDQLGKIFSHDIRALGVHFDTRPLAGTPPTARSMIFVTPDGERSMNTYLGACVELGPEDIEADVVADAKVTYFEGYLWDPPRAKDAIRLCAEIGHRHGREMSMTLSDPFCVGRYREEFLDLMRSGTIDIVFANSDEAKVALRDRQFRTCRRADPQGLQTRAFLPGPNMDPSSFAATSGMTLTRSTSTRWWIPPVRATCMRQASCMAMPTASRSTSAGGSAAWPQAW